MLDLSQQILHELEAKCVKEQPPAAMAACPLHVDCRGLCSAIASSDFDTARELFEKSAVFPKITACLCEGPCQNACLRSSLGGALHMQQLEKAAITYGTLRPKRQFLPKKSEKAAVIGAGLTGLCAALELGKKGYHVTVFEEESLPGGWLLHNEKLSSSILEEELKKLSQYKIEIHTCHKVEHIEDLKEEFHSIFIAWGKKETPVPVHPLTRFWKDSVFAGGDAVRTGHGSVPEAIADGKSAAISIDRFLKRVSLEAGREDEFSSETNLHVKTKNVPPLLSGITAPDCLLTKEEAIEEAGRCLLCTCTDCIDACAFMRNYKAYPKKYLREIYNNLAIAMGTRHANKMINSCSLCGQCASVCPHGLDLGEVVQEARNIMVSKGKMPASAFDFALKDMTFSNSEECFLAKNAPEAAPDIPADYAYFPGCQLWGSAPGITETSYLDLKKHLPGHTGLILGCCGIMAKWAGQTGLYEETAEKLREAWETLGQPVIITACPTCRTTLKEIIPELSCKGIWEILQEEPLPPSALSEQTLEIHDACGARQDRQTQDSVRSLAAALGCTITEGEYTRETSACCGYGGLTQYSNPDLADEMAQHCTQKKSLPSLTYCINCRDRFLRQGQESYHILELLYDKDGKEHRWPTYSARRSNRFRLRQKLLKELWQEETKGEEILELYYTKETCDLLEKRMILESDICAVLSNAEETGYKILDTKSNLYIAHKKLGNVTFWVYYRPEKNGYFIDHVYAHRMEIKGE